MPKCYSIKDNKLILKVLLQPGSNQDEVVGVHGDTNYQDIAEYINLMREDQTWGLGIEAVALARAFNRQIVIITPGNCYDQIIPEEASSDYDQNAPIFLNYVNDNHYVPLAVPPGQDARVILAAIQAAKAQRNNEEPAKAQPSHIL